MKIPRFIKTFAFALPMGVAFVDVVGYIAKVDGTSMQPSLNPVAGQVDFVLLNKWAVRNYEIARGDIISLISPKNPDQRYIKRVVALEGDVIPTTGYKSNIVTIPQGHCWVEGDHLGSSLDSNTFGPVALGLVTAKATHIIWPPSRFVEGIEKKLDVFRQPVKPVKNFFEPLPTAEEEFLFQSFTCYHSEWKSLIICTNLKYI